MVSGKERHDYEVKVVDPTYESAGYSEYACKICGYSNTGDETGKLTHNYSSEWSHDGNSHWHACTDAGYENLKSDDAVHTYEDKVIDPTYEAEGYTTHTCTVCGYYYTDSKTSKLEHNYSKDWSHDGNSHWHACIDDGYESLKKDEGDHSFEAKVIAPTYDENGCTRHTCTVCGYYYDDAITDKLKYAITWEDSDGTVLRTDRVEKGETPSYGEDPEKEMGKLETYSFAGWEPAITPASCDMTYKATYQTHKSENEFVVMFDSNGGDEFSVTLTKKKDATLTLPDTWPYKEGYVFCGWSSIYEEKVYGAEDEFDGNFNVVFFADWLPVCSNCDGSGGVSEKCSKCNGTGKVTVRIVTDNGSYVYLCSCSACKGTGKMAEVLNCSKCGGSGYTLEDGPKIEKVTPNSITLTETDGYEYSMDGSSWQSSPTFGGLTANTAYSFYQRKAMNGKMPHGFTSKATSATTLRSSYSITYVLNGGVNSPDNPASYSYESEDITLKDPSREGYTFDGWYCDESLSSVATGVPSGSSGNLTFYAKWEANLNKLTAEPEKASRGTVTVSGSGYTGEKITVTAKASPTYTFGGWYSNGYFASSKNPYTFRMPNRDVSLTAVFLTKFEAEELEKKQQLGMAPAFRGDCNNYCTVTYGLYPQTHVSDETLVSELNKLTTTESNGWYLYDGSYYAKKIANPRFSFGRFSDGTKFDRGKTYWFKCEPIEWEIRSSLEGTYSLVSTSLLDTHCFHSSTYNRTINGEVVYPNNYKHSDIRSWLNDEFYNSAFALDNFLIQTVSSVYSADSVTEEKVYLPYYSSGHINQLRPTDWAKASGILEGENGGFYWEGGSTGNPKYALTVTGDGYLSSDYVSDSSYGVRPGIRIKIA